MPVRKTFTIFALSKDTYKRHTQTAGTRQQGVSAVLTEQKHSINLKLLTT